MVHAFVAMFLELDSVNSWPRKRGPCHPLRSAFTVLSAVVSVFWEFPDVYTSSAPRELKHAAQGFTLGSSETDYNHAVIRAVISTFAKQKQHTKTDAATCRNQSSITKQPLGSRR